MESLQVSLETYYADGVRTIAETLRIPQADERHPREDRQRAQPDAEPLERSELAPAAGAQQIHGDGGEQQERAYSDGEHAQLSFGDHDVLYYSTDDIGVYLSGFPTALIYNGIINDPIRT